MWNQTIIVEAEAESGDVADAGASGKTSDVKDYNEDDNDEGDDEGKVRPHFDKNIYTFSAAAGRALQQQTGNIKNLV